MDRGAGGEEMFRRTFCYRNLVRRQPVMVLYQELRDDAPSIADLIATGDARLTSSRRER
jgi:hypothetical protein